MTDDQFFLANAYLDGELTAEEQVIADADPEILAEVERLRALQAVMRDVEPPSDTSRERGIAAALAEFDAGATTATATAAATAGATDADERTAVATPASPAVPIRSAPRYGRLLGIAAAVVAVGLLGVVVANNGLGGSDDDSAGDAGELRIDDAGDDAGADDGGLAADDAAEAESETASAPTETIQASADAAEATAEDGAMDEEAANEAPEATEAMAEEDGADESAADEDAGDADVAFATVPPAIFDDSAPIAGPEQLAAFVRFKLNEIEDRVVEPTPETTCNFEPDDVTPTQFLTRALFLVDVPDGEVVVDALIGTSGDGSFAVAADDSVTPCELLAEVPIP